MNACGPTLATSNHLQGLVHVLIEHHPTIADHLQQMKVIFQVPTTRLTDQLSSFQARQPLGAGLPQSKPASSTGFETPIHRTRLESEMELQILTIWIKMIQNGFP